MAKLNTLAWLTAVTSILCMSSSLRASLSFFEIDSVTYRRELPSDGYGVWVWGKKNHRDVPERFSECLEVNILVKESLQTGGIVAKAYFYDQDRKLLSSAAAPSKAGRIGDRIQLALPPLLTKGKSNRLFFEIPEAIKDKKWNAVVVVGDATELKAACYPSNERPTLFEFPERKQLEDRSIKKTNRSVAMDPLIETVVTTKNPKQPQITLFLRSPKGVKDSSEIKGVMAICVLSTKIESLRRELQKEEMDGDYAGLFSFANENKMAILIWAARRLWNSSASYNEMEKEKAVELDESFDLVADGWAAGVRDLMKKYELPSGNFLLWGNSASAQWAQRLCLRKPEFFSAVYLHIPSSFDQPTPKAANVIWCLTTGELEDGYERSKVFFSECRRLGYPIIYKAVPGLGHQGHIGVRKLSFAFFDFVLAQNGSRTKSPRLSSPSAEPYKTWHPLFRAPPFVCDIVNQSVSMAAEADSIPVAFQGPLPSSAIAKAWAECN